MEESKKQIDWKNVGWRFLQALIILLMLSPIIVYIVLNNVDFSDTGLNYYLVMSNKEIVEIMQEKGLILWYDYHWYYKFLLWLFMILGAILTIVFIKFLYKNNKEKKREQKDDEKNEKWNKTFEKIFGKEKE